MRIKLICSIVIFLLCRGYKAQRMEGGSRNLLPPTYSSKPLDVSLQNFYYAVSFVPDIKNHDKHRDAITILQVGKQYSKYVGINTIKIDSLMAQYSKKSTVNMADAQKVFAYHESWRPTILKDLLQGRLTRQETFKTPFEYEESVPQFNWRLKSGDKKIMGYECKLAEMEYKGRSYTAWYAPSIPLSNGPYIFGGLPGLILELMDSKDDYHFVMIANDHKPSEIYIRNDSKIIKTTKDKFLQVEHSYYDNPALFHGHAKNQDGTPIIPKAIPYNPLEL